MFAIVNQFDDKVNIERDKKPMLLKKKRIILLLIILLMIISLLIIFVTYNKDFPPNQFNITETDPFCLAHSYNVNGKIGYEKTEFSSSEKRKILGFIASLDNEELLEEEPTLYGIPAILTIKKQDSQILFLLYSTSNIRVVQMDDDENIISRKKYTTTLNHQKEMYRLLDLPTKELT